MLTYQQREHWQTLACRGKRRYTSADEATDALFGSEATYGETFAVYPCRWCWGFHIGHNHQRKPGRR